jgi:tRNA-dihydrouridine synthase
MYRGEADWGVIDRVADAVDIPVIGSGDVRSAADAARMLRETGATSVMVARGTYGNPWVFRNAQRLLEGKGAVEPTTSQRLAAFACHVLLLEATGAHLARARSLAGWYLRGLPHAAQWRERAMHCQTLGDYLALVEQLQVLASQAEA